MIEDDDATSAVGLPSGIALDHVVCVGSVSSIATLVELAARGATVFNQAAPILVLLELVQAALMAPNGARSHSPSDPAAGARRGELLQRQGELQRLAQLTAAETDTLRGIVSGLTATEIATRSHHSVHTVRSHLKAILSKLEVRTQVGSVAIAHRSAPYRWIHASRARFTNFGEEAG